MGAATARVAREDWRLRDAAELDHDELVEALKEPDWRLRHLYWIIDKEKRRVCFTPWKEQEDFIRNLWFRNIVLKARQRGFSTLIQLMMLDTCLFNDDIRAAIIAHDKPSATTIFRDKIKYAYDNLPEIVRHMNPLTTDSKTELMLANNSSLQVSVSVRSGTLHFLHVSEYGKICAKYPDKAREIQTGSLPAVPLSGIICIESTAEGQEGDFFAKCKAARAIAEQVKADPTKTLSRLDYRFHFAPWWDADEYQVDPALVPVSPQDHAYFDRLEGELGILLGAARRAWYVATRDNDFGGDRELMMREYPATPTEAFQQATEGTYLAEQLARARREGRVGKVPYDPALPVNTWWDLGHGRRASSQCLWFHQRVGIFDHWLGYIEGSGEAYGHYVGEMQNRGYVWGTHHLPHDGAQPRPGMMELRTSKDMLYDLGLRNIEIVPRIEDFRNGIQMLKDDFVHYRFDEEGTKVGLSHLGNFRRVWNKTQAVWSDEPRRDEHMHAADAIRQKAQWYLDRSGGMQRTRRRNKAAL